MLLVALQASGARGVELSWSSVDGGGATFSSGGGYRLGATIGQSDAGVSAAEGAILVGGFWAITLAGGGAPTPTVSATGTRSPSPTPSFAASGTATATLTPTAFLPPTGTPTRTSTFGPSPTPTRTFIAGPSPTPTPTTTSGPSTTPTPTFLTPLPGCVGDCNGDGHVRVDELVRMVNIALDLLAVDGCEAGDRNGNGRITIDEVLLAVTHALGGCTPGPAEGEPR